MASEINDVTICNSALTKLGAERILSLDDDTPTGRLCNLRYESILNIITSMHPWRIARKRIVLAPDDESPAFGYDNQFSLPADFLQHFVVSDDSDNIFASDMDPTSEYKIEGGKLLGNFNTCYMIYIRRLTTADLPHVHPTFAEAVSNYMAWEFVMPITQSDTSKEMLLRDFERSLKRARTQDARGDSPRALEALEFLQSRVQGHYDFDVFKFTT